MITSYMEDPPPDLTPEDIKRALERPPYFAYFGGDPEMFVTWAIGPTIVHRDSGIIDRSNARVLKRELEKREAWAEDWRIERASHCMVGWVDHLCYRVTDAEGKTTPVARFVKEWFRYLKDDYPIADEDDHSALEMEVSDAWIEEDGKRTADRLGFKLPEDWQWKVYEWWEHHRPNAREDRDDQGASPDEDDYRDAFEALGFAREE